MSKRLVIDTSMAACSVGLFNDDISLFERTVEMRQGHQEAIGGLVYTALSAFGITVSSLDMIGVTLGPGSFTGLRIGLSFAKGLSVGAGIALLGISALEAMLFHPELTSDHVMAMMDGGRGKLFVQTRQGLGINPAIIVDTKDDAQLKTFIDSLSPNMVLTGNGLAGDWPFSNDLVRQNHPHLRALNQMLTLGLTQDDLTPLYMREADASVSRKPILQI